jgi:hypothetical protein
VQVKVEEGVAPKDEAMEVDEEGEATAAGGELNLRGNEKSNPPEQSDEEEVGEGEHHH